MPTQTAEKIYREVKELRKETNALKELFFLVLQDPEGKYKNSFIKKIIRKSRSKPRFSFTTRNEFLKQIS